MADVYQTWDNLRSTRLAVKVLRQDLVYNPRFLRMFTQEASLYRQLEHPNIVRIYGFEREGDLRFIIMDWVDGSSLGEIIAQKSKPLDLATVSKILSPLASALHYAHNNQVYHCDVKPANVLMHKDGKVLLTDFGVARLADSDTSGGTAPYMAPEQFANGTIDARTDIYSLGITLYQVLSGGKVPFTGESSSSRGSTSRERIAWEHLNLQLPSISKYNKNLPAAISTVITTALAKNPAQRYHNVMDLREAFEHARLQKDRKGITGSTVLQDLSGGMSQPNPPKIQSKPLRRTSKKAGSPCIYGLSGEFSGQMIAIPKEGLSIGRSAQNYLQLREQSVSRNHAIIWLSQQGAYVRDEHSALGTYVNNQKISQPYQLSAGDRIQIGYYDFFEYSE